MFNYLEYLQTKCKDIQENYLKNTANNLINLCKEKLESGNEDDAFIDVIKIQNILIQKDIEFDSKLAYEMNS